MTYYLTAEKQKAAVAKFTAHMWLLSHEAMSTIVERGLLGKTLVTSGTAARCQRDELPERIQAMVAAAAAVWKSGVAMGTISRLHFVLPNNSYCAAANGPSIPCSVQAQNILARKI